MSFLQRGVVGVVLLGAAACSGTDPGVFGNDGDGGAGGAGQSGTPTGPSSSGTPVGSTGNVSSGVVSSADASSNVSGVVSSNASGVVSSNVSVGPGPSSSSSGDPSSVSAVSSNVSVGPGPGSSNVSVGPGPSSSSGGPGPSSSAIASSGSSGGDEEGTLCDDGLDNDFDGFIDCADFDCEGPYCGACEDDGFCTNDDACTCADCFGDQQCGACDFDGICDYFLEDCSCFDCVIQPVCDNVGPQSSGAGPGAVSSSSTGGFGFETGTDCDDGLDNDFNGVRDCEDPGCADGPFCGGCNTNGICSEADDACTCDDCVNDFSCTSCDLDGICDFFFEQCDCSDCANEDVCD